MTETNASARIAPGRARLRRITAAILICIAAQQCGSHQARAADTTPAAPQFAAEDVCDNGLMDPRLTLESLIAQYRLVGPGLKHTDQASLLALVFDANYCTADKCTPAEATRQQYLALVLKTGRIFPLRKGDSSTPKGANVAFLPAGENYPAERSDYFVNPGKYPLQCSVAKKTWRDKAEACVSNFLKGSGTQPVCPSANAVPAATAANPQPATATPASPLPSAVAANPAAPPPPQPAPAFSLQGARLRDIPDQITQPAARADGSTPFDTLHSSDTQYLTTNGAKISFGRSAGSTSVADTIVGTVGYGFAFGPLSAAVPQILAIPYVSVDREGKFAAPGAKAEAFSADTIGYGLAWQADVIAPTGQVLTFSLRPDYLQNFLDGSRIFSLNTKVVPTIATLPLNHSMDCDFMITGCGSLFGMMLQFDLRANVGWFTDVGKPADPRLNHDYVRWGTLIGPQFEFKLTDDLPIDLGATYTDYIPSAGFKKSLGDLQAALTFNFDKQKIIGLTGQYVNGRRDDTAARVQMWLIGLTLHY